MCAIVDLLLPKVASMWRACSYATPMIFKIESIHIASDKHKETEGLMLFSLYSILIYYLTNLLVPDGAPTWIFNPNVMLYLSGGMKIIRGLLMKIDVIKKRGDAQARKVRAPHTCIAQRAPTLYILKRGPRGITWSNHPGNNYDKSKNSCHFAGALRFSYCKCTIEVSSQS